LVAQVLAKMETNENLTSLVNGQRKDDSLGDKPSGKRVVSVFDASECDACKRVVSVFDASECDACKRVVSAFDASKW
jgi:thiol-disulfide isomerase/thioredoxin